MYYLFTIEIKNFNFFLLNMYAEPVDFRQNCTSRIQF